MLDYVQRIYYLYVSVSYVIVDTGKQNDAVHNLVLLGEFMVVMLYSRKR